MNMKRFPVIDPIATGKNIIRLRVERGMSVRDLQAYFGFENVNAQRKKLITVGLCFFSVIHL